MKCTKIQISPKLLPQYNLHFRLINKFANQIIKEVKVHFKEEKNKKFSHFIIMMKSRITRKTKMKKFRRKMKEDLQKNHQTINNKIKM